MSKMDSVSSILCLDIGNTTCRSGIWSDGKISQQQTISTKELKNNLSNWLFTWKNIKQIAFCSVVPEADKLLMLHLESDNHETFRLTALNQSGLPVQYPKAEEIGSDRIANSYAVYQKYKLPAVVIDLGTATTFDVVTKSGGYRGGVILPGPQGMLDYLGCKTALLPKIELATASRNCRVIGQDTQTALMSGILHGYLPMLLGILEAIKVELGNEGEIIQSVIQTGGESKNFLIEGAIIDSTLTLDGLALACLADQANR
jgi:type III pantothenate kinase